MLTFAADTTAINFLALFPVLMTVAFIVFGLCNKFEDNNQ